MANNSGAVSATRETDAFGNVWAPGTSGTTAMPFGFAGQHGYQTDADSGLMRLGHRYYDSSTGRFLSRDPIQDGYNWYAYCNNDPVNAVDPKGLKSIWGYIADGFQWLADAARRLEPKPKPKPQPSQDPPQLGDHYTDPGDPNREILVTETNSKTKEQLLQEAKDAAKGAILLVDPTVVGDTIEVSQEAGKYTSHWTDGENAGFRNRQERWLRD